MSTETTENAAAETDNYKMSLDVTIEDVGPCKKHIVVRIPRDDISHHYDEVVSKLIGEADVPGFRKGHVPKKLVERRFKKELSSDVKQRVLLESLEQISEEHDLNPINEPDIDIESLTFPEEGDFEYEFDVEVRPVFELPDYEGLTIERPTKETTDEDVERYLDQFLSQYGQLVPHAGAAAKGDHIVLSAEFARDGETLRKLHEVTVQLKPVLRFRDAELESFDELMSGVEAGQEREADMIVSQEAESIELRGETVHAKFMVHDVKQLRMPELNKEFLDRLGIESEDELRSEVRSTLERQTVYAQRQSAREQVLAKITESADWDLPELLVRRQVDNALRRQILEMQQAGFTPQEIRARENELRQQALTTTRQALKEHFVLDKIAMEKEIKVTPGDIQTEIGLMAAQSGESPRRVRARLAKSGMIENLEAQICERKAIDFILDKAKFKDVKAKETDENRIEALPHAICGIEGDAEAMAPVDQDEQSGDGEDSDADS